MDKSMVHAVRTVGTLMFAQQVSQLSWLRVCGNIGVCSDLSAYVMMLDVVMDGSMPIIDHIIVKMLFG